MRPFFWALDSCTHLPTPISTSTCQHTSVWEASLSILHPTWDRDSSSTVSFLRNWGHQLLIFSSQKSFILNFPSPSSIDVGSKQFSESVPRSLSSPWGAALVPLGSVWSSRSQCPSIFPVPVLFYHWSDLPKSQIQSCPCPWSPLVAPCSPWEGAHATNEAASLPVSPPPL